MTSDAGSATLDPRTATDDDVVLQAVNISKTYGVTRALKGVNFEVRRGKVTVLFGENGAGKSTLMKILSGVEQPTGGQLILDGEPVRADLDQRRCGPRDLDHPPGAEPVRQPERPRQHLHRARAADQGRRDRLRPGEGDHRAADGSAGGADQAGHPGPGPAGGPAADHRDRPGAGRRRSDLDHGRAHLGVERDRGRGVVQGHPRPDQQRRRHRLHLPPPRGSDRDRRLRGGLPRRRSGGHRGCGEHRPALGGPADGGPGSRLRLPRRAARLRRRRPRRSRASRSPSRTRDGSRSTTSRSMCARARSSACTA